MNAKTSARRRAPRSVRASACTLLLGLMVALHACSVYDESLKQGDGLAPTAGSADAGSGASSGVDAGGSAGTPMSGGTGNVAGGNGGDAGTPSSGGDAGEPSSGGTTNGGSSTGGRAGAASAGSGGLVAAAGSAGTSVSGGAGNPGTAGAASDLSLGKASTASTQQPANPSPSGNDGQTTTRWSATTAALPQWWRVDLGASHTLSQVSVQFEFPDRKYTYAVETSTDDSAYATQANVVDGMGAVQVVPIPNQVSARYVRITCTSTVPGVDPVTGASRPTWMSFWEVSVQGS